MAINDGGVKFNAAEGKRQLMARMALSGNMF